MGVPLGFQAKLYRNTGTYAAPNWSEVDLVKDLSLGMENSEADVTTRRNNGFEAVLAALRSANLEFGMPWDTSDTNFKAVRDAFLNRTAIEFAILDGNVATSGTQGLRATMTVLTFNKSEQLREGQAVDVSIKPTHADNAPEWMEIA